MSRRDGRGDTMGFVAGRSINSMRVLLIVGLLGAVLRVDCRAEDAGNQAATAPGFAPVDEGGLVYEGEPIRLRLFAPEDVELDSLLSRLTVLDAENTTVTARMEGTRGGREMAGPGWREARIAPLPVGYYTVAERGSPAFTKFAVIRRPIEVPAAESPFGVDAFLSWAASDPDMRRAAARDIRRAGILWVRDRLSWAETQPSSGTLTWGRYDDSVTAEREARLSVLQVFHDIPEWVSSLTTGTSEARRHVAPRDPLAAERYFEAAARHWQRGVAAWELWNEFDIPVFFEGTPDEYASVLRSAAIGTRRGNPDATILSGSTTLSVFAQLTSAGTVFRRVDAVRFVDRLLCTQVSDCFDVWTIHYYGPAEGVVERIRQNRELLRNHGVDGARLWLTETGHTATLKMTARVEDSERRQADDLVKVVTLALSEGVERIFYFCFPNFFENGTSPWGLVEARQELKLWLPKPAWAAYANLAWQLASKRATGHWTTSNPDIAALVFEPGVAHVRSTTDTVIVAWSRNELARGLELTPAPGGWPAGTRVFDVYGRTTISSVAPNRAVALSVSPVFIAVPGRIRTATQFAKSAPPTRKETQEAATPCPLWCEIDTPQTRLDPALSSIDAMIRVVNADREARTVRLTVDVLVGKDREYEAPPAEAAAVIARTLAVPTMAQVEVPARVVLDGERRAKPGQPLALRAFLFDPARRDAALARTVRFVDVDVPVSFERTQLISPREFLHPGLDSFWSMRFVSHSASREELTVMIQAEAGAPSSRSDEVLARLGGRTVIAIPAPGTAGDLALCRLRDLRFAIDALGETPRFRIRAETGGWTDGMTVSPEVGAIPWASPARRFPPWVVQPAAGAYVIGSPESSKRESMRAEILPSWDSEALCFNVRVADREVMNPWRLTEPWLGDALEIFLDVRDLSRLGAAGYGEGVFQIFVVPPDRTDSKTALLVWQPRGRALPRSSAEVRVSPEEEMWEARVRLAWKDLGIVPPEPGREIGIDFALDDRDFGDFSQRQIVWRGTAEDFRDPRVFARVQLVRE